MSDDFEARRQAARGEAAASSQEWWSPLTSGDRVEGEVIEVSEATSDRGKVYTVLTLELGNGRTQKVGCARTVLADKAAEAGIEAAVVPPRAARPSPEVSCSAVPLHERTTQRCRPRRR